MFVNLQSVMIPSTFGLKVELVCLFTPLRFCLNKKGQNNRGPEIPP